MRSKIILILCLLLLVSKPAFGAITFNDTMEDSVTEFGKSNYKTWMHIYRKVNGTFSADEQGNNDYDYFDDNAQVGDCIYFVVNWIKWGQLTLNVGTAMAGTGITIVWE